MAAKPASISAVSPGSGTADTWLTPSRWTCQKLPFWSFALMS